jgi:hypothetical protein
VPVTLGACSNDGDALVLNEKVGRHVRAAECRLHAHRYLFTPAVAAIAGDGKRTDDVVGWAVDADGYGLVLRVSNAGLEPTTPPNGSAVHATEPYASRKATTRSGRV